MTLRHCRKIHPIIIMGLGLLAILALARSSQAQAQQSSATVSKPVESNSAPEAPSLSRKIILKPSLQVNPYGFLDLDVDVPNNAGAFFGFTPGLDMIALWPQRETPPIRLILGTKFNWRIYHPNFLLAQSWELAAYAINNVPVNRQISFNFDARYARIEKSNGSDRPGKLDLIHAVQLEPALMVAVNKAVQLKGGYWVGLYGIPNWNAPTPQQAAAGDPGSDEWGNLYLHSAVIGIKYQPLPVYDMGVDYRYVFAGYSNSALLENTGHFLVASVKGPLPWKGGQFDVKDTLWLHTHDKTAIGGGPSEQDSLNSFSINLEQDIDTHVAMVLSYTLVSRRSNRDVIETLDRDNAFYVGVNFHL